VGRCPQNIFRAAAHKIMDDALTASSAPSGSSAEAPGDDTLALRIGAVFVTLGASMLGIMIPMLLTGPGKHRLSVTVRVNLSQGCCHAPCQRARRHRLSAWFTRTISWR
jgi:hypothetical protein